MLEPLLLRAPPQTEHGQKEKVVNMATLGTLHRVAFRFCCCYRPCVALQLTVIYSH